jgi:hypothetical protein
LSKGDANDQKAKLTPVDDEAFMAHRSCGQLQFLSLKNLP